MLRSLPASQEPALPVQKVCDWHKGDTELSEVLAGPNVYALSAEVELSAESISSGIIGIHVHPQYGLPPLS